VPASKAARSSSTTLFTAAGDSGSDQTITSGNTLSILGGTGLATVGSATDTITINVSADALDFTELSDTLALDADTSIAAAAGEEITYNKTFTNAADENGFVFNFTASDTTSGTTSQYGIYLDNLASTEGLDAAIVIDNSDADDAVVAAIKLIDAGGGFTTVIDNAGTLISGSELNLLDSGIALSELTDSGTLTAGTVDINGGNIDGTAIGAASASTGVFTTIDTGQGAYELYAMNQA